MTTEDGFITRYIEKTLDGEQFVAKELLTKLFVRINIFNTCVLITPLLAIAFTALVPATYKASTQVLIRYTSTESAFFGDLVTEGRTPTSGPSSAQMMKSIPVLARTIQQKGIKDADIYKDFSKVLGGHIASIADYFSPNDEATLSAGTAKEYGYDRPTVLLAKSWKGDDKDTAIVVETTEKPSNSLTSLNSTDELITITVKAFNRLKVADMANGVAESFIEEYYTRSALEAKQAYDYLDILVKKSEKNLAAFESNGSNKMSMEDPLLIDDLFVSNKRDRLTNSNPRIENTARDIANLETELAKYRQNFKENSFEITQIKQRIADFKKVLSFEERLEAAKDMLGDLKMRRQQASLTKDLYSQRLIPITIVEPAFIPQKSAFKLVARFLISGIIGLVFGVVFGLGLVVIFNLMDRKLYTSWDIRRITKGPILGLLGISISEKKFSPIDINALPNFNDESDVQRILGRIESLCPNNKIITVTSASDADANPLVSLQLACSLAKDHKSKVLLIDGNFSQARQEIWAAKGNGKPGIIDVLVNDAPLDSALRTTNLANLFILPVGDLALSEQLGFFQKNLQSLIKACTEKNFDMIIIDSQSILSSREALLFCTSTPVVIINATTMVTRSDVLGAAIDMLAEAGRKPIGTIMLNKTFVLPDYLYKLL